ncbi:MAG: GIY-YIG nuclease family protein [Acidimicrobiales bacterium]|nr:GIY-YIG nuclease family protein [Acidimicrobiales bacterium]MYD32545.1 GIY-YIG nuclease family protein [Acidimicrobiales bacterium]MYI09138.1 GIY-YIG nuclease family protein [Acidimicrobiales bacterium]
MAWPSLARKGVGLMPDEPLDVTELYDGVDRVLGLLGTDGRAAGDCKFGVYLFSDYDGEPIYVGQTREQLRTRIRRHLTNQRTDAVAMRVLDPFEVAAIEMWPFWDLHEETDEIIKDTLDRAEFTVYQQALADSLFNAVLNEGDIPEAELIELPNSVRGEILPGASRTKREHPDIRIARRARTIADLARVISERKVQSGIRRTLWVQAQRLEYLARTRLRDVR